MASTAGSLRRVRGQWQAVVRYRAEGGEWRSAARMTGVAAPGGNRGRRAALVELERLRLEVVGTPDEPAPPPAPVAVDYISDMVESLAAAGSIQASTAQGYRATLKLAARVLGRARLDELVPRRMERAYARLSAEGLSPSSVGKVHRLVRQACMRAAVEGVLERDPTVGLKAPRRRNAAEGINALDREGRARLLSALASMERTPLAEAALVALYTGLRQGEVCGLRWSDYDEGAGVLWVRRSIGRGGGACYVKEPKNGRSRDVAVPARLAEELAAWRAETAPASPSCYVLSGTADFYSPERVCHGWTQLSAMLGLVGTAGRRCTFHDLRHTWATVAVASGVDIKTVASNLGHANAAMTLNVYASADPEAKRRAAETVGAAM